LFANGGEESIVSLNFLFDESAFHEFDADVERDESKYGEVSPGAGRGRNH